jgi:hypothetical protein
MMSELKSGCNNPAANPITGGCSLTPLFGLLAVQANQPMVINARYQLFWIQMERERSIQGTGTHTWGMNL